MPTRVMWVSSSVVVQLHCSCLSFVFLLSVPPGVGIQLPSYVVAAENCYKRYPRIVLKKQTVKHFFLAQSQVVIIIRRKTIPTVTTTTRNSAKESVNTCAPQRVSRVWNSCRRTMREKACLVVAVVPPPAGVLGIPSQNYWVVVVENLPHHPSYPMLIVVKNQTVTTLVVVMRVTRIMKMIKTVTITRTLKSTKEKSNPPLLMPLAMARPISISIRT
mmetsp:Transcript_56775/g.61525  ORF Transcript_56775/g.61525 Transcript_56775/m.61525 type:complete len:217 (-) Transcript_56775:203-853(-)